MGKVQNFRIGFFFLSNFCADMQNERWKTFYLSLASFWNVFSSLHLQKKIRVKLAQFSRKMRNSPCREGEKYQQIKFLFSRQRTDSDLQRFFFNQFHQKSVKIQICLNLTMPKKSTKIGHIHKTQVSTLFSNDVEIWRKWWMLVLCENAAFRLKRLQNAWIHSLNWFTL